jgi:hypothetical protein
LALEQVSARVDALIGAWESPQRPPTLREFLPENPLELRRLVLTELIKVDLEYRWQQHNLPKTIEEYLAEFPELADAGKVPCDLIYEEYHIRRQSPDPPDPSDYLRRFPAQAEPLKRMLNLQADHTTTAAVARRRTSAIRSTISTCFCGWAKEHSQRFIWPASDRCSGSWRLRFRRIMDQKQ